MTDSDFIALVAAEISRAKTPATAARNAYRVCCAYADQQGMSLREVQLIKPWAPRCYGTDGSWYVSFEAGPYEWAVVASLNVDTKGKVLAEPYYNFDLCFSKV